MTEIVIFSIGNPGTITRHSVGHLALKHIISHFGAKQLTKSSTYSSTTHNQIALVKSNTYMNESDKALKKYFETTKPSSPILIVVYDDFESELSKVKISKLKKNESHNGIKAVARYMDNDKVFKLGIGIGPKPLNASKDTMANWVLSPFKSIEREVLESKSIPLVIDYIEYIIEVEGDIADCNKVNSYFAKNR